MPLAEKMQPMSLRIGPEISAAAAATFGEQIRLAIAFLRRRYRIIVMCLLASVILGVAFLYMATPIYTATATMMIETQKNSIAERSEAGTGPVDAAWIESQIEILKSPTVAAYIVKQLHLADDPEFVRTDAGFLSNLRTPAPRSDAERTAAATSVVMNNLRVRRIGPSYVIAIEFRWRNGEQATKVANAVIDGYIFDQLNAKYQANRRAGDWLQERLQALREQAASAQRAVIEFKAKNNIVAASGTLINEKQLSEITGQLATARSHASDMQARLLRIDEIRQSYQPDRSGAGADETISDELSSPIITNLRTKYLEYVNREAEYSTKYGKDHTATVNLRSMIRNMRVSIYDELGRIQDPTAASIKSPNSTRTRWRSRWLG